MHSYAYHLPARDLCDLCALCDLCGSLSGLNLSEDDLVVNNFGDPRVSGLWRLTASRHHRFPRHITQYGRRIAEGSWVWISDWRPNRPGLALGIPWNTRGKHGKHGVNRFQFQACCCVMLSSRVDVSTQCLVFLCQVNAIPVFQESDFRFVMKAACGMGARRGTSRQWMSATVCWRTKFLSAHCGRHLENTVFWTSLEKKVGHEVWIPAKRLLCIRLLLFAGWCSCISMRVCCQDALRKHETTGEPTTWSFPSTQRHDKGVARSYGHGHRSWCLNYSVTFFAAKCNQGQSFLKSYVTGSGYLRVK